MKKHIDPLSFTVVVFLVSAILLFTGYKSENKNMFYTGIVGIILSMSGLFFLRNKGTAKVVKNDYEKELFFKPEYNRFAGKENVQKFSIGVRRADVDGIELVASRVPAVRKFSNGVNVIIDSAGNAHAVNFISRILGQSDYATPPDESWKPLFDAIQNKK